jgi:Mrp family chromosome partitioning ATPase
MINIFKKIDSLKKDLTEMKIAKAISNFHISLRMNNELSIYLLSDTENEDIEKFILTNNSDYIEVKVISESDRKEESYYQEMFSDENGSVNIKDSRRRFGHLLDDNSNDENLDTPCPVITFYSYKGGMGRSTTLASFATALANGAIEYQGKLITPKKVVIIDCDFEAPGFNNYFLNRYC